MRSKRDAMAKIHLEAAFCVLRDERQAVIAQKTREPCGQHTGSGRDVTHILPLQSHLFKRSVNIGHHNSLRCAPHPTLFEHHTNNHQEQRPWLVIVVQHVTLSSLQLGKQSTRNPRQMQEHASGPEGPPCMPVLHIVLNPRSGP